MSKDFDDLLTLIEEEAAAEGPQAVEQLENLREEFGLASQVIAARRERNMTQAKLARASGIAQSEISRIETGVANPTYSTLSRLAKSLGRRIVLDGGGASRAISPGRSATARSSAKTSAARGSSSKRSASRKATAKRSGGSSSGRSTTSARSTAKRASGSSSARSGGRKTAKS